MIIFLYGPDTYRSWQKLKEIVDHSKETYKNGLNIRWFDSENFDFQEFKSELETNSMFREKKLIILEDVFSDKDFKGKFLEKKEKFADSENVILIYEKKEPEKSDTLFKYLKEKAKCQEFALLSGEKLNLWIKKEFGNYKAEITPEAAKKLVDFVGNDLWQMENEIRKLAAFKISGEIKEEDVGFLVNPKIDNDIFKTIDALAGKEKNKALSLLHLHLEKGDAPLYLLSMINFQFRNILVIKDLAENNFSYQDVAKKSKLHPFVARKSFFQSQKFEISRLKKIYRDILRVDLDLKTGKMDSETALDLLISSI